MGVKTSGTFLILVSRSLALPSSTMSALRQFNKLLAAFLFFYNVALNPGNGTIIRKEAADFGGDFTAGSLSGAEAPGPSAGTMGKAPASAMGIGTGGMGPGDYTSSYKTPNYTQYTQQDFKGTVTSIFYVRPSDFLFL